MNADDIAPLPERRSKRGILAPAFRKKLGGISDATLWRLQKNDPRFPQPGRVGCQRIWDEIAADNYAQLVFNDVRGKAA